MRKSSPQPIGTLVLGVLLTVAILAVCAVSVAPIMH